MSSHKRTLLEKITVQDCFLRFTEYFKLEEFNEALSAAIPTAMEMDKEFPPCFCHNDMHCLNLIYDKEKREFFSICHVMIVIQLGCFYNSIAR